jgi:hypothetical protein
MGPAHIERQVTALVLLPMDLNRHLDTVEVGGMGWVLPAAKDLGRIRVICRATRRRIHQRTAASGTTTVTRARTMPPDSSWLQMRAFPVTSWRRWAYGMRWPW